MTMRLIYICLKCRKKFKTKEKAVKHTEKGKCKGALIFGAGHFGTVMKDKRGAGA